MVMKAPESNEPAGVAHMPLPSREFQRFLLLFHIVFIAGMSFIVLNRWHRAGSQWGWPEINVSLLVAAQIGVYLRFFALPLHAPAILEWWGFYFPVSLTLWFITWRSEPAFEWMVLGYLGQLFGVVPPRYSVPAALAVFLVWLPTKIGWAGFARLGLRDWLGYLSMAVAWSALGLFIHKLAVTSAERAQLIQELRSAQKELELAREQDQELAALRERERLARELHDSLGHGLVTLTVQLEAAQKLLTMDPTRASSLITEMKALTRTSMQQLRRSLAGLRTPGLGERALAEALEELCSGLERRTPLRIERSISGGLGELSPALCETVWRVAQEGLINIERHAQATGVRLVLELDGRSGKNTGPGADGQWQVVLRVADDGVGMPADAEARPGHYGLRGLRERVEGLGGTLTITPNQPKGTVVQARLPLLPGTA